MDMCHGMTWRSGGGPRVLLLCLQLSLCLGPARPTPGFLDIDACSDPRVPDYGIRTPSAGVFFENAITRFHCLEGYTLKGPTKKQCVRHFNGSLDWKPSDGPVCLQKVPHCLVPHVEDAEVRNKTYRPGDKLIMNCHDGFQTRYPDLDNMASECQDDGSWDNLPICQGCLRPLVLPHSFINISEFKSSFPVGRVVYYQCFPGYKLEGAEFLECMYNLIWSDRPPKCLDVEVCPLPPMVNHGDYICHPQPCESYIHGTVVEFYCDHGYTLTNDYRFITCRDGEWIPSYQVYCVETAEKSWPGAQETLLTTWKILAFTASSVLLVLLLVIIAKSFQSRFKAYFLPRVTLDRCMDPDFVVVDGIPVMLPSYDEAVSSDLNALTPGHCPSVGQGPTPCVDDLNPPAYPGDSNTDLLRAEFQTRQNSLGPSELFQNLLCSSDCQTEEHSVPERTGDIGVRGEALPIEASTSPSIDIPDEIPLMEEVP